MGLERAPRASRIEFCGGYTRSELNLLRSFSSLKTIACGAPKRRTAVTDSKGRYTLIIAVGRVYTLKLGVRLDFSLIFCETS